MTKTELINKMVDILSDPWTESKEELERDKWVLSEDLDSGDVSNYIRTLEEYRDDECRPFDGVHGEYDFARMKEYDEIIDELKKWNGRKEQNMRNETILNQERLNIVAKEINEVFDYYGCLKYESVEQILQELLEHPTDMVEELLDIIRGINKIDCSDDFALEIIKDQAMTDGLFKDENGYIAYRHNGIKYDFYDGVTMGRKSSSDITFLMVDSYDFHVEFVAFEYGSSELEDEENLGKRFEWIDRACDEWERENQDIVERIWKGEIKEL